MRTRLLIAFLLAGAPSIALAQRGGVGGRVVDDEGKPLDGVSVVVKPSSDIERPRTIKTKADGTFLMMGLSPGRYELSYSKEGHERASQDVHVEIGARNRLGDIVLPRLPADYVDPGAQQYFDAGVAASRAGDFQKAAESFKKVNEMAPNRPEVLYNLGFAYEKLEQIDAAVEQYEKALELRPEYYDAIVAIASIHTDRREWSEAAGYYERAIPLRPNDATVLYNYGAVAMNAGTLDQAVGAFEKVLAIEPGRAEAHYQLGMIAASQQRNEDALVHLQKYLEQDPEGPKAAVAKGIVDTLSKQP